MKKEKQSFGVGKPCRKCGLNTMIRKRLTPPKDKNFYYKQWEFCKNCNAVYFEEQHKSGDWQDYERQQSFFRELRNE